MNEDNNMNNEENSFIKNKDPLETNSNIDTINKEEEIINIEPEVEEKNDDVSNLEISSSREMNEMPVTDEIVNEEKKDEYKSIGQTLPPNESKLVDIGPLSETHEVSNINDKNNIEETDNDNNNITNVTEKTTVMGNEKKEDITSIEETKKSNNKDDDLTNEINNTNSNKIGLIVFIVILIVLILLFCYNYFFRLSGVNNVKNTVSGVFETVNKNIQKISIDDAKTINSTGNYNLSLINEETINIGLNYEFGLNKEDFIAYLDTNLSLDKVKLLNIILYLKNNKLYFIKDNDKLYYKSMEENILSEIDNIKTDEITYLISVISKGITNGIDKNNISKKIDGVQIKTIYSIDSNEMNNLYNSILKELKNDSKSVEILKNNDIDVSMLSENILEEDNDSETIAYLYFYNNIITGKLNEFELDLENNKVNVNLETKIVTIYKEDKAFMTLEYNEDKLNIKSNYVEDDLTFTCDLNLSYKDNEKNLNGTLEVNDTSSYHLKLELNNSVIINSEIKTINTTEAIDIDSLDLQEQDALFDELFDNILLSSLLSSEEEISQ